MNLKSKFLTSLGITIFLALASSSLVSAQNSTARMGIKGGFNVSNLYINNVSDENSRFGFNAGFYGQLVSSDVAALQLELLYTTKGTKATYNSVFSNETVKFNLNYLEVPVLAVIKLGKVMEIHAGGYAGYLLAANFNYNNSTTTHDLDRNKFNSFDYGLAGGVGFNFGAVQLGARYNYGLAKIANSDAAQAMVGNSKNSCAQLYLAFNLNSNQ